MKFQNLRYWVAGLIFCGSVLTAFANTTAGSDDVAALLMEMRSIIERQNQQIAALNQRVTELEQQAESQPALADSPAPVSPIAPAAATPAARPAGPQPVTSRFGATLYGYVKLDAAYDTHRMTSGNLAFHVAPKGGLGSDDQFNMTARQTRVGVRLTGPDFENWKTRGQVEMDFAGSASENATNPRIRLAFVQMENDNWRLHAGQAFDLWNTVTARTVNFATMGQQGAVWSRRPLAYAVRKISLNETDRIEAGVGIARTIGISGEDGGKNSGLPNIQWNIVYHTRLAHGAARFGLGGHYGWETLGPKNVAVDYNTSLIVANFFIPFAKDMTLAGSAWTGKNLGNFNGGVGQGINTAKGTEIRSRGGWLQLGWKPHTDWQWTLFAGIDDPRGADLSPNNRASNKTIGSNIFWSATSALTFAFEYQYMTTEYFQTETADSHRFQSAVIFNF